MELNRSYRSRNYEHLNSEKSSTTKMPWLSQSMITFKPNESKGPYNTNLNVQKTTVMSKDSKYVSPSTKTRHSRVKTLHGVIPVFKHHQHGKSMSTTAVTTNWNKQ